METKELRYKTVKVNEGKKMFYFRIAGGVYLRYVSAYDCYYLNVPQEVAEAINEEIAKTVGVKYQLDTPPRTGEDGKVYTDVSMSVKLYELKSKIGDKNALLTDCVLKFSEYTYNNKKGLSKTLTECKIGEINKSMMTDDDFFGETDGTNPMAGMPTEENLDDQDCKGFPFDAER